MRKAVWLSTAVVLAVILVTEVATAQGGRDTVTFKDGTPQWMQVKVTKETYKGVEVAGKGTKHPSVVENITHGDQPASYVAAAGALRRGDYQRAQEKFLEAMKAKARPWLKHYCTYYLAVCKQKMADKPDALAKAIAAYQKVIKESPNGIKVPDAKFGIGQCYYQMKQLGQAQKTFAEIAKSDYGEFWQLAGKLWEGKILLEQGKGAEAAKVFDEVQKAAKGKMPDIYYKANLSRAAGLIQANPNDTSKARDLLQEVFNEAENDTIKAAAHNGMGDAYRAEKRIKEARLEYLRVIVLYFDCPEEHARALFNVADCFDQLKDAATARRFRNMLVQQHPDSVWRKRLGGK
ncbi:MAG: tetratricopeptide repeat protein [Planctomycetes bacterium]|nr:tetratricopeptide repeat protein [Planctomycetota bacterium]